MKHWHIVVLSIFLVISVTLPSSVFAREETPNHGGVLELRNVRIDNIKPTRDSYNKIVKVQFLVIYIDDSARTVNVNEDCIALLEHFSDDRVHIILQCYSSYIGSDDFKYNTNEFELIKKIRVAWKGN